MEREEVTWCLSSARLRSVSLASNSLKCCFAVSPFFCLPLLFSVCFPPHLLSLPGSLGEVLLPGCNSALPLSLSVSPLLRRKQMELMEAHFSGQVPQGASHVLPLNDSMWTRGIWTRNQNLHMWLLKISFQNHEIAFRCHTQTSLLYGAAF